MFNFFTIKPQDSNLITTIKQSFEHSKRSFYYRYWRLAIDCLYCHASPGVLEATITELDQMRKGTLLNLGGGTGQVAKIFSSLGYEVFNVDIDINPDKTNDHNINFNLNSQENLPFLENQFDVVVCQEIIEHLENPWQLFRGAKRVLQNEGMLIVSTPNIASSFSKMRFLLTNYFNWFTPDCFNYHINPLPYWEIELIATQTGFQLIKIVGNGDFLLSKKKQTDRQIIKNNEELIYFFKIKK